jgi:hypothetical protein
MEDRAKPINHFSETPVFATFRSEARFMSEKFGAWYGTTGWAAAKE